MTPRANKMEEAAPEEKRRLMELLDDLEAIGSPGEVEQRDPFEFPDRPGL